VTFVGTAGWTIPAQYKDRFASHGTHLERYAARLNGVEINSSFYRPHKRATYARWAAAVPEDFRFSVKLPRMITQNRRLTNTDDLLKRFLEEVSGLDGKLGVLLVQLPPSLTYDAGVAEEFFHDLAQGGYATACEPRHASWFTPEAEEALRKLKVARVAADPPRAPTDGEPGGDRSFSYFRLHGSPKIYHSDYAQSALESLARTLREKDWCIFDNTAAFHALGNALSLRGQLPE
jgi:uncharacterized protein YecE (DUF72 family)